MALSLGLGLAALRGLPVVALWVLIILSLLIGAFAFDMHIEAGITSFYRKRLRSQYLATRGRGVRAGTAGEELHGEGGGPGGRCRGRGRLLHAR